MTGIAISMLIKNPGSKNKGEIFYFDIGDSLTLDEKKDKIKMLKSIKTLIENNQFQQMKPDKYNDWINQRDDRFYDFISIGDKKNKTHKKIFSNYSRGLATSRDSWCYNFSKVSLDSNMRSMISFYKSEIDRYSCEIKELPLENQPTIDDFVISDTTKISWNRGLKNDFSKGRSHDYKATHVFQSLYRPFTKQWVYFDKNFNDMVYQMPKIFPQPEIENKVIMVCGKGSRNGFSILISKQLVDLNNLEGGTQCFPLYLYEKSVIDNTNDMFEDFKSDSDSYRKTDGISDETLEYFQLAYPNSSFNKEDVFYYIYGLLHSKEYQERYADNLSKELPRIPCVKRANDFWIFSQAGRELAELHINYETVKPHRVTLDKGNKNLSDEDYYVTKMKFAKRGEKQTVTYNSHITITDIPLEAYDYVVNGKPALEWVMERQSVTTDKKSGIVNDANDWAIETMGNAKYPLELFQRVITVSLETMKIVNNLPKLDVD